MRQLIVLLTISAVLSSAVGTNFDFLLGQDRGNANKQKPKLSTGHFGSQSVPDDQEFIPTHVATKSHNCDGPGTTCIPYYQCNDGRVNIDGAGLFDIRTGSACPRYLDVCCGIPGNTHTHPPVSDIYRPKCGRRNFKGIGAHVGSLDATQAQFGEFPWMAAILRVEQIGSEEVNLYLCGGSLITHDMILTAAHCVLSYGSNNLKVRVGEWDTQSDYEGFPHQDRYVRRVITHPQFNGANLQNDIALLVLESNFKFGPNVDAICIPPIGLPLDTVTCLATGWGKDEFGKAGLFQSILKKVKMPTVAHDACEARLKTTRLGIHFSLHDSFLCAGGVPGIDTCKGDGGSPYVCPGADGTYYQVGIVAWGIGCGENGIPGVYVDVSQFSNWIHAQIQSHDNSRPNVFT